MPDVQEQILDITSITHPNYDEAFNYWWRWRLAYEGSRRFITTFLKKFSSREDSADFQARQEITYCPRFAGAAIDEIKNSIFQRMVDVNRIAGTASYQEAIKGGLYGVDLLGSSMTSFIGRHILSELLVMKKVGIYVDMPIIEETETLYEAQTKHPYIYMYAAEDIRNWQYDDSDSPNTFQSLLLKENQYINHPNFDLPIGTTTVYKHFYTRLNLITNEPEVHVDIYSESEPSTPQAHIVLNIPRIPFVVLELSHSLMADISDYQIALLNLGSSDISYALKANYPFYTEQFDPRAESQYLKSESNNEIDIGPTKGRRYPIAASKSPEFIHPSSEPLLASMKKQDQLKTEIRLLLNLAISNLMPSATSAESKGFDERSLESGLSYIGLELEYAENQIGEIWSLYENSKQFPKVSYPSQYSLRSDKERQSDANDYAKLLDTVKSLTYKKEISKAISTILLRNKVSDQVLKTINAEIDKNEVIAPPDQISTDVQNGIVSAETASEILGYPPGEIDKANAEHSDRLARIAISQSQGAAAARGVGDLSASDAPMTGSKAEKEAPNVDPQKPNPSGFKKKQRGGGK